MVKLSRKKVNPEHLEDYTNNVWNAFTLMDSKIEIRLLFKDLFTHTELKMVAKRLEIARRLQELEMYDTIQRELAVTATTIAVISNQLAEQGDGFRLAHAKLKIAEEKYLKKRQEEQKNLENPFRKKVQDHGKTVLGAALKAGIVKLDKSISQAIKKKSIKEKLNP
jgi:uncharacterized protein YerC